MYKDNIKNRLTQLYVAGLLLLFANAANAATYYSRVTGAFATIGNWSTTRAGGPNTNPFVAGDIFIIETGNNMTIGVAQTAASITVESGGILTVGTFTVTCTQVTINSGATMALGTAQPSFSGSITNSGYITGTTARLTANTGTFINNGSIAFTTGRITRTTGALTNNGTITLGAGRFTATSGAFTNSATGTMTVTGIATITLGTGNFVNSNTSASVNFGSSGVGLTGTTRSVGGFITTGAVTPSNASGTITVTGNINGGAFTKSNAGTINMGAGLTHTFTGTFALGTAGSVNGGSSTINVLNATAWSGTVFDRGNSTVVFGAGNQTVTGTNSFYNLTYAGSGTKTMATYTVYNTFRLEGTAVASAAPTYEVGAGLVYNTSNNRSAGAEWVTPFTRTGGVTIAAMNITTNNSKVFNVDVPLTINSGAILTPAVGHTFSFGGDFINNGTWTPSTGSVTIALGRTTQSIGSFTTSGNVEMTKTGGTATLKGNVTGAGIGMNGALGTLSLGTGLVHAFSGNLTGTGGTINGNTSTLRLGGAVTVAGLTFNANTGTVDYNGSGAQSIPTVGYFNLQTSTGNTKTLAGATTVSGVLTINSGSTFATGANILTLSGTGTPLVDNGTFTATAGGTVIYSGATATIAPETYANLQTSTAGIKTLAGNTTASLLTINAASTLATGANTLTLSGTGTPLVDNGTFTASAGSTVIYIGATATIAGENYINLQTSTAGAKTLGANTSASGVVTINTGSSLALNTFTLTLSGTGTPLVNSGGTFTPGTGTVIYNAATADIAPLTYYNLQTATAGIKTLAGNTTVTRVLTINSGTLNLSDKTLTISFANTAPIINSGTFVPSTGKVIFSGAAQTVISLPYFDLQIETAGIKTLAGSITVSGVLTIQTGSTFTMGAGQILTLSGTGTPFVNNSGNFNAGTSTVLYSNATATIAPLTYYNLQIQTAGMKTLGGNTTVSAILTINALSELNLSDKILTLSGIGTPIVNSGGTFTAGSSTVVYSGTTPTITPLNYFNLTGSAGGPKIFPAGTIRIAGTFNPAGGTYNVDNANIVNFNGAGPSQTIPAFSFKKMILSGSGQKIIATTVAVTQVDIETGPTMDITTGQLDIL